MIRCDLEGVSGVVSYEQAEPGKPEYPFGLRMFRADLTACVEGLLEGGSEEVVIYDEHCAGRNIDPEWLPEHATAICGKPPYRADWAGGLDESFAGVVLLGFHSKAGTPGGLLHHSYELDIRDLRLNGVSVGEIGMEAAIAGDCGVAVLMVSGDSAGVAEARALLGGTRGVSVKESLHEHGGRCLPLEVSTGMVRSAAREVAAGPTEARPFRVDGEVTLEVELADGPYLEDVRARYGPEMRDGRTLVLTGPSATAVWADYWQRKLLCQKPD
jgi:D-amino peptidase